MSPRLLQLSGVGDAAALAELCIATVHDLPGVGGNLQDHLQIRPVFRVSGVRTLNGDYRNLLRRGWMGIDYALFRRGPLTMAPSQLGMFARSSPDYATANLQFHFQPLSLDKWGDGLHPFDAFTASVCNLRPSSRGTIRLASPDPHDAPLIAPHYLSTEEDLRVAVDGLRLARRIAAGSPDRRISTPTRMFMVDYRPETSELRRIASRLGVSCGQARVGLGLSQKLSAISISPAAIASVKRS